MDVYTAWAGRHTMDAGLGVLLPAVLVVTTGNWHGYSITLTIEYHEGRYRCLKLEMKALSMDVPGDPPDVPIAEFVQAAAYEFAKETISAAAWPEGGDESLLALVEDENETDLPRERVVAFAYRLAEAAGAAPRRLVAESFKVSPATAGRWTSEARKAGLLPHVEAGTGGGRRRQIS